MVSSAHPTYRADIVRLIHGDPNPLGPGFIEEAGRTAGERRLSRPGAVDRHWLVRHASPTTRRCAHAGSFTVQAWIMPTLPQQGPARAASRSGPPAEAAGFALLIEDGELALWLVGLIRADHPGPLVLRCGPGRWYFVAAAFDAATGEVQLAAGAAASLAPGSLAAPSHVQTGVTRASPDRRRPCSWPRIAGERPGRVTAHYNGKIDRPRLFTGVLSPAS